MTRDEAEKLCSAVYAGGKDSWDARQAIIAALTAAPEKPRVDVRKLWAALAGCNTIEGATAAVRAAGYETIE